MNIKRKNYPYVLRLKKNEKPVEMTKERYETAIASASKRLLVKK